MARDYAAVNLSIWQDDDFRDLPPAAQWLYFTLWTHPTLSYCGVTDWRPGKLAALSRGWKAEHIERVADCLRARHFIVTDDDTEEVLIRSWVRFDGLMKQPRLAVSFANAYAAVGSKVLRGVIVDEANKNRERDPGLVGWTKPQVAEVLSKARLDVRSLPTTEDPFGDGFGDDFGDGFALGLAQTQGRVSGSVKGSVSVPPTPAPAPAPLHQHREADASLSPRTRRRKPEKPIPDDWKPSTKHAEQAMERGVSLSSEAMSFRDHAVTHDRRCADWDAAFRNWLRKAKPEPATVIDRRPEAWR